MKRPQVKRDFWIILACRGLGYPLGFTRFRRSDDGLENKPALSRDVLLESQCTVPLLFYYLLKSWALVFGSSDLTIRL